MTGKEIIEWIRKHHAEEAEIYIEVSRGLFKPSEEMAILGSEDCPCMDMVVIE